MKINWKRMKSKHYKRPQIKTKQILKRRVTTVLVLLAETECGKTVQKFFPLNQNGIEKCVENCFFFALDIRNNKYFAAFQS